MQEIHKDLIGFVEQQIPFHRWLGVRVESVRPGVARVRLPFRDEFRGNESRQAMHGGVVAVFIDVCGAVALWSYFGPEDKTATVDMRVDYQRPAPFEDLVGEAEVRMLGNRLANVDVRVFAAGEPAKTVAEGRSVYYVKRVKKDDGK